MNEPLLTEALQSTLTLYYKENKRLKSQYEEWHAWPPGKPARREQEDNGLIYYLEYKWKSENEEGIWVDLFRVSSCYCSFDCDQLTFTLPHETPCNKSWEIVEYLRYSGPFKAPEVRG